jgi:hypothetical protein
MIWKHQKILIWSKENNKKVSIFFKNAFETQKQTGHAYIKYKVFFKIVFYLKIY